MRRAKKILIWGLGALLFPTLAVALFLVVAGDDFYRWILRQAIEGRLDRDIRVEGTFDFEFGLEPTVTVTEVSIADAPWTGREEMARAERLEVQVAIVPLLSGIIAIPRLTVHGLQMQLERSAEGRANWDMIAGAGARTRTASGDLAPPPLIEVISLRDIAVTYSDRRSGARREILIYALEKTEAAESKTFDLRGEGKFDGRRFQVGGRFGSFREVFAGAESYPVEFVFEAPSGAVTVEGVVHDPLGEVDMDLAVTAESASLSGTLSGFGINLPVVGIGEATARVRGDLQTLAVEDITLEILERSGQELRAEGRIANIVRSEGLDLRFSGRLDSGALRQFAELPVAVSGVLDGLGPLDVEGRLDGRLTAPNIESFQARVAHGSGGELTLSGRGVLDFAAGEKLRLEAQTELALPDRALLERALGRDLPDLGAVRASAKLILADGSLVLHGAEAEIEGLERLRLTAEGEVGELSGPGFVLFVNPDITFSATVERSRPLIYLVEQIAGETAPPPESLATARKDLVRAVQLALEAVGFEPGTPDGRMGPRTRGAIEAYQRQHDLAVDGRATAELLAHLRAEASAAGRRLPSDPETLAGRVSGIVENLPPLGPVTVRLRLFREEGAFQLDNLSLELGTQGELRVEVTGRPGSLDPDDEALLEEIALAVRFTAPSTAVFAAFLPPETPLLGNIAGKFEVRGTTDSLAIAGLDVTAQGPDGLAAAVKGGIDRITFVQGAAVEGVVLDLEARWPDSKGIYRLANLNLSDLGPVWVRARLAGRGESFALSEIDARTGAPDAPALRLVGEIADFVALKGVGLEGKIDAPTATLLGPDRVAPDAPLGSIRGDFLVSDKDGTVGLESLNAEVADSELVSLSVSGAFDDFKRSDDLRMDTSLTVPNLSELGEVFGYEGAPVGSLAFNGEVAGSDESFSARGDAQLGETSLTTKLSGSLAGTRPKLRAEIYSPRFRFSDVGLVPDAEETKTEEPETEEPEAARPETANPETGKSEIAEPLAPVDDDNEEGNGNGDLGEPEEIIFDDTPIPFEALRLVDLDLKVVIEDIEGIRLDIDKANGELQLADGVLKVDPLNFSFVGGRVDMTLEADARPELPTMKISLTADDVNLGKFISQADANVPLDGDLDLLVDVTGQGGTPHALASSLSGDFDLAASNGRVLNRMINLTAESPFSWVFAKSTRRGYSEMNCIIMRFDVQDGFCKGRHLVMDTPTILAFGEGYVDLRKETINIRVQPKPKSRRLVGLTTPFTIEGPLADPDVRVSTRSASVRSVGEVLLSPVNLLGSLLPFSSRRRGEQDPCLELAKGLQRGEEVGTE